jgi:multidrug efflux system membrane fusion protein
MHFRRTMLNFLRALLPVVILAGCAWWGYWFLTNQPQQEMREMPAPLVSVEGLTLKSTTHAVRVASQGTVQPRTRSTLLPEVAGKVVEIGAQFRPGGFIKKDEILVKLDPVDYETAITIAQAAVAQAKVTLVEEKARADQARENWKTLGRSGDPGELVARVPQVARAEADVAAAEARVVKARRDLERTIIRAPYDGQVIEQSADIGQYVGQGTVLGRIFATDYVEIRLPLPERESQHLTLPERFRDGSESAAPAKVHLRATHNGKPVFWEGSIVRVESALDAETRQSTAIAQVIDPYARRGDDMPPLKIGQFVEAEIEGSTLEGVYLIPRSAVRAGNEIIVIDRPADTLRRMTVEPLLGDEKNLVVSARTEKAPKEGQVLCLTPIPFPADGAKVKIGRLDGQNLKQPEPMAGKKKKGDDTTASRPPPADKPLP